MLKILLGVVAALAASVAFAAVDINKADQAALESVKGVGTSLSARILEERKKGAFKDWNDLVERVRGVGGGNAAKFSAAGLTVNGAGYAPTTVAQSKKEKPAVAGAAAAAKKKEKK